MALTVTTDDRCGCVHGVARREFARFAELYRIEYQTRRDASPRATGSGAD